MNAPQLVPLMDSAALADCEARIDRETLVSDELRVALQLKMA